MNPSTDFNAKSDTIKPVKKPATGDPLAAHATKTPYQAPASTPKSSTRDTARDNDDARDTDDARSKE